jgi:hypothetical protein
MATQSNLKSLWEPHSRKLVFRPAAMGMCAALIEPDGKIRLAVACERGCKVDCRTAGKDAFQTCGLHGGP